MSQDDATARSGPTAGAPTLPGYAYWPAIETAPMDGSRVDLWAKIWLSATDSFISRRFPNCYWTKGDIMTNRRAAWVNMDGGYVATHWMPLPPPPAMAPTGEKP